jgi:4-amino-4-deoxy-L-arabinose transferase-like glycosyltransferase
LGPGERAAAAAALPRRLALQVSALFCVVLAAGWLTRDFGFHWDEKFQVQMVQRTARTGSFLPHWYRYPSLTYWLSLVAIAPAAALDGFEREAVIAEAASPRFKLRGRMLYWGVAYLALFWVAALAWRLTGSEPAGFLAALVLALSFEFHYHARWMTSDAINAQLVALAVLLRASGTRAGALRTWWPRPSWPAWLWVPSTRAGSRSCRSASRSCTARRAGPCGARHAWRASRLGPWRSRWRRSS